MGIGASNISLNKEQLDCANYNTKVIKTMLADSKLNNDHKDFLIKLQPVIKHNCKADSLYYLEHHYNAIFSPKKEDYKEKYKTVKEQYDFDLVLKARDAPDLERFRLE